MENVQKKPQNKNARHDMKNAHLKMISKPNTFVLMQQTAFEINY